MEFDVPPPPPPPPPPPASPPPPPPTPPPRSPPPPPPPELSGANPFEWKVEPKKNTEPLDLEKWLAEKKARDAENKKIRFIPKKERERMAREKEEKEQREREEMARAAVPLGRHKTVEEVFGDRVKEDHTRPKTDRRSKDSRTAEDRAAELTRLRYYGPDRAVSKFSAAKKRQRQARNQFSFDWDASEDTTANSPYAIVGPSSAEVAAKEAKEWEKVVKATQRGYSGSNSGYTNKPTERMTDRDWRLFKSAYNISAKGEDLPNPIRSWSESKLSPEVAAMLRNAFQDPTPMQMMAVPIALQRRDLIGVAPTGSGKTMAFLVPLFEHLFAVPWTQRQNHEAAPHALILAPNRDLAQQILAQANRFSQQLGFRCVDIIGGHDIGKQIYDLGEGVDLVVATTGRLLDLVERHAMVLSRCHYMVIDEADRMLEDGFEDDVRRIFAELPSGEEPPAGEAAEGTVMRRQTLMFTATMPNDVALLARQFLHQPAQVTIGTTGEAVDTVEQRVEFITGEDKRTRRLEEILRSREFRPPCIVFVNNKHACDYLSTAVQKMGVRAKAYHGGKTQQERERVLGALRDGSTDVLISTDLGGRGLDISNVSLVVNFEMCASIDTYTHRIGRTGRAGKSGVAITFLGEEDADVMYALKQMILRSSVSKLPDKLRRHPAAQQAPSKKRKAIVD